MALRRTRDVKSVRTGRTTCQKPPPQPAVRRSSDCKALAIRPGRRGSTETSPPLLPRWRLYGWRSVQLCRRRRCRRPLATRLLPAGRYQPVSPRAIAPSGAACTPPHVPPAGRSAAACVPAATALPLPSPPSYAGGCGDCPGQTVVRARRGAGCCVAAPAAAAAGRAEPSWNRALSAGARARPCVRRRTRAGRGGVPP